MRKIYLLAAFLLILGCRDEEVSAEQPTNEVSYSVTEISFKPELNASVSDEIVLDYDGMQTFTAAIPYEVSIENLIASITLSSDGGFIQLDGSAFQNEVTAHNFGKEVELEVFNSDQSNSWNYTIRLTYFTGLPILNINTDNIPVDSRDMYVNGTLDLFGGLNYDDIDNSAIQIRGRGNSTWFLHPKKPFQIKFESKTNILGMPEDRKWVLLAEYSDKTMLRNKLTYEMGAMSSLDYTPTGEYIELFLNNTHQGTYLLAQKVEESSNRVQIGDDGYLIEIDQQQRVDPDDVFFTPTIFTQEYNSNVFNIKAPNIGYGSPEFELIENHINNFESVLFGPDFTDPDAGYRAFVDLDSFVDWFLINEIAKTVDAKWYSSIYFTYIPGEKIKMGPLWDFDLSYGNVDYADSQYVDGFWVKDNLWISRMFEDPYFQALVEERFDYYYNSLGYFNQFIDDTSSYLNSAQEFNYGIWQSLGVYVWPNPVYYDTYEEEITHLKQWLSARLNWLAQEF